MPRDPLANPKPLVRRVYAYVAYRIGDGPDAQDVTSETFARALRYRSSFDPTKGDSVAWLLGIARRCIHDAQAVGAGEVPLPYEVAAPGELEAQSVERLDLRRAVLALDPRDRELIALRYGADLTARQIAALLGERTNTVEVALHRALDRLRTMLAEPDDQPRRLPVRRRSRPKPKPTPS
jgi:RNA polymerase sigma factor (sigma-70 family)